MLRLLSTQHSTCNRVNAQKIVSDVVFFAFLLCFLRTHQSFQQAFHNWPVLPAQRCWRSRCALDMDSGIYCLEGEMYLSVDSLHATECFQDGVMPREPWACKQNLFQVRVRRSKENTMKATWRRQYSNGTLEVEQLFRPEKRTGRGLSLTIRKNDLCKANISTQWHSESRTCSTFKHLPIVNIKAGVADEQRPD